MSRVDGIRSFLEDYILLFILDVCMYVFINVANTNIFSKSILLNFA